MIAKHDGEKKILMNRPRLLMTAVRPAALLGSSSLSWTHGEEDLRQDYWALWR